MKQDVHDRVLEKNIKNNTAMGCVRIIGDLAEDIARAAVTRQGEDHE